jgi:diguanylate cyclase (GGDEF)-like protein/PAS domain S-box-containing protein
MAAYIKVYSSFNGLTDSTFRIEPGCPMTSSATMQQQIAALEQELEACRRSNQALQAEASTYSRLVANTNAAVLVVQDGTFQFSNPKAQDLLGYPHSELAARPLTTFFHGEDGAEVMRQQEGCLCGEMFADNQPFRVITGAGATIWADIKMKPFTWQAKPAVLFLVTDISERIQTEEKYRRALASRLEGFVLLDNDRIITEVNPALLKMSGYDADDFIGRAIDHFYVRSSVDFYSASRDHFSFEALFRARDGREIPMLFSRSTLKDENHRNAGFMYFLTDLSDLKAAQDALQNAERRYRNMYENALQGMFQSRLSGRLIRVNPAFARILGYDSVDEVLALAEGAHKFYFKSEDRAQMVRSVLKKGAVTNYELQLKRKDGKAVWILGNIRYVRNAQGKSLIEGILVDNTRKKALERDLRRDRRKFRNLAIHNNLTGLFNTRYLYQKLDRVIAESRLSRQPFSLVFMDMDNFKRVVDTHGHLNGSQALKEVAATIKSCLQKPCFGVAYGGDEFVVVLPGFDKRQATRKLEQIRERMGRTTYLARAGLQVLLAASFGVATFPDDTDSREGLLALADRAMFHIKQTGKGAIGLSPPSSSGEPPAAHEPA